MPQMRVNQRVVSFLLPCGARVHGGACPQFSHVSGRDVLRVESASKWWAETQAHEELWRMLFTRDFGALSPLVDPTGVSLASQPCAHRTAWRSWAKWAHNHYLDPADYPSGLAATFTRVRTVWARLEAFFEASLPEMGELMSGSPGVHPAEWHNLVTTMTSKNLIPSTVGYFLSPLALAPRASQTRTR